MGQGIQGWGMILCTGMRLPCSIGQCTGQD